MKSFLAWLWGKIKTGGRWLVTLLILIAILIVGLIISKNKSDDDNTSTSSSSNRPEVAQVFEPSIGTPIPADTQPAVVEVAPAPAPAVVAPTTGVVAGSSTTTAYVAPKTGINPNEPIVYKNNTYGFTATLPAHSTVREDGDIVSFFASNGTLLYTVSIESNAGTLDTITEQLRNSSGVKNIVKTSAAGHSALQFTTGAKNGLVILNGNIAFYLIGQKSLFTQFTF